MTMQDDHRPENGGERSRVRTVGSMEAPGPKRPRLRMHRRRDHPLEEEVERLDQELRHLQTTVKSLMCIYQTLSADDRPASRARSTSREDPTLFSQLFQAIRPLENEMDRIAALYIADDTPSTNDHRRLDSLYQGFVEVLLRAYPSLSSSSVSLDSLLEDDSDPPTSLTETSVEDGEGYSQDDEGEMMGSLRTVQQSLEGILAKTARGETVDPKELDALDHWYQVFASFR